MTPRSPTALLNDLYQFTMAQGYVDAGTADRTAVFDVSFRRAPFGGAFAVAAGIDEAVAFVEDFRFSRDELDYLAKLGLFSDDLLHRLDTFKFSGDVSAVPEGTLVFPRENLLRVTAPLLEAQLLETPLLNTLGFSTLTATKSARIQLAANGAEVFEFGCRRAQRQDGALAASRCAYLAGCAGTSNLEAGRRWQIPVRGTMAHSWVLSFGDERQAFRAYARRYPDASIFLIDTYDTLTSGLPAAIDVALEMQQNGHNLLGVRLDSGDPHKLSLETRTRLDAAGLPAVKIVVSGDLDEYRIADLVARQTPIDVFGVGTSIAVCPGEPSLSIIYKLGAIATDDVGTMESRHKSSDEPGKATLPGIKEIYRYLGKDGSFVADQLALSDESPGSWAPPDGAESGGEWIRLLEPHLERGQRTRAPEGLEECRQRVRDGLSRLGVSGTNLEKSKVYPVRLSPALDQLNSAARSR